MARRLQSLQTPVQLARLLHLALPLLKQNAQKPPPILDDPNHLHVKRRTHMDDSTTFACQSSACAAQDTLLDPLPESLFDGSLEKSLHGDAPRLASTEAKLTQPNTMSLSWPASNTTSRARTTARASTGTHRSLCRVESITRSRYSPTCARRPKHPELTRSMPELMFS
jgi:hypothetical protein